MVFQKGRVLAQDGGDARKAYDELVAKWTPLAPAVVRSLEEAGKLLVPSIYSSARTELD